MQRGIVYGPTVSGRFGLSLGVNLSPGRKRCNFGCAYCELGPSDVRRDAAWPEMSDVLDEVEHALSMHGATLDSIIVAGNGEPTLHPGFAPIADNLARVRDRLAPRARLALRTNGSTLNRLTVFGSLARFDNRCIKLDAGDATTFRLVNAPGMELGRLIGDLRRIGRLTLQSMFVRDRLGVIDNTTPHAVDAWIGAVDRIQPSAVDLRTLRCSGINSLRSVPRAVLDDIADRVRSLGVAAHVCP